MRSIWRASGWVVSTSVGVSCADNQVFGGIGKSRVAARCTAGQNRASQVLADQGSTLGAAPGDLEQVDDAVTVGVGQERLIVRGVLPQMQAAIRVVHAAAGLEATAADIVRHGVVRLFLP